MIEAWFAGTTHRGTSPYDPNSTMWQQDQIIPCLMPSEELHDIARLAGIPIEDLFSIDIPSGASREARIKCVVAQSQLDAIYKNRFGPYGDYSIPFRWRTDRELGYQEIWLFPLPPKPIFVRPGMAGVYLVEAVDCRYYWKRTPFDLTEYYSGRSDSTGRSWSTGSQPGNEYQSNPSTPPLPMNGVQTDPLDDPFSGIDFFKRYANLTLTPECSAAMFYDLRASLAGAVIQWMGYGTYKYKTIGNDWVALNAFMQDFKNAAAGGIATTSGASIAGGSVDGLIQLWQGGNTLASSGGSPERQIHRAPSQMDVLFPLHTVEAKTYYNNDYELIAQVGPLPTAEQTFMFHKEYGPYLSILTARDRYAGGVRLRIKEPWTIPAASSLTVPLAAWPNAAFLDTISNTNDRQGALSQSEVENLAIFSRTKLTARCEVQFGRIAWAGWLPVPPGAYRATMLRYTVSHVDGEYVPVTITEAREDDWILGPDGLLPDHPRDLVFGQGTIHARRTHNGALQIDSAPPMCRTFPARIKSHIQVPNQWRWKYEFEEVEPLSDDQPNIVSCGLFGRSTESTGWYATNLCESYNNATAGAGGPIRIAPGVLQSDFPDATIQAKPIDIGVIVMMTEQFPQTNAEQSNRNDRKRRYWFSMPNAVKVICTPFTADTDYGSFAAPSALYDDYGTFEAPENNYDYGTF